MSEHIYIVQYGVNNSHMCEFNHFDLYRDAVNFYKNIDSSVYKSAAIIKILFSGKGISKKIASKEAKMFRFEPGVDNTTALSLLCNLN